MLLELAIAFLVAFLLCAGMIRFALPFAGKIALAVPNARSSHDVPTPQSGGLFLTSTIIILAIGWFAWRESFGLELLLVFGPAVVLALIGWLDDRRGLPVMQRLVLFAGISVAYSALKASTFNGLVSPSPGILLSAGYLLVLINITNFMDGIDGLVVAEFVPMNLFIALLAAGGLIGQSYGFVAIILAGALSGFFVFNRPKAKIFLGDSGSLVVGFIGGALLLELAEKQGPYAVIVLPLYFLCDAGLTLLHRLFRGERVWNAHREHFYQQAYDKGQSNWSIIIRVAFCNVMLCALFYASMADSGWGGVISGIAALVLTGGLLVSLSRIPRVGARKSRGLV